MRLGSQGVRWVFVPALLGALVLAPVNAGGFLDLDGVAGETGDRNHPGWIEIHSFSHGMTRWDGESLVAPPLSTGSSGPGEITVSRAAMPPLSALYLLCVQGKELASARVDVCAGKGRKRSCVEYVLSGVVVRTLDVDRPRGERPLETLTLGFSKMRWYPAVPGSPLPAREADAERADR